MFDTAANTVRVSGQAPAALRDVIATAMLDVTFPDGHTVMIPMHDDGLHSDGLANDGEYGSDFVADETGTYTINAVMEGTNSAGAFIRSSQHLVYVIPNFVGLSGSAV